jgi:hypothetical protein
LTPWACSCLKQQQSLRKPRYRQKGKEMAAKVENEMEFELKIKRIRR